MVYVNVTLKVLPVNASHPRITVPRLLTMTFTIAASGQSYCRILVTEGIRRQRFELAI
jgi:hypothetical protein